MRRRTVVLGGAASAMLAAVPVRAQQPRRTYRVGILSPLAGLAAGPYLTAFREQMAKHGLVEGRNLSIDVRSPDLGHVHGVAAAKELLAVKPDALFPCGTPLTKAAQEVTASVPIVFTWVADPVFSGIVKDLSRPGGNTTGVTNRNFEMAGKRLEILRELLPSARRVAMVYGVYDPLLEVALGFAQTAAQTLKLELVRVETGVAWQTAVRSVRQAKADAMVLLTPFAFFGMRLTMEGFVRDAAEQRIPAIYPEIETVEAGGLMSYASNLSDDMRRGADRLVRVLRGEHPGDLAVDQASRFELAINLKTSRAIGLKIPQSLLIRADRVIE